MFRENDFSNLQKIDVERIIMCIKTLEAYGYIHTDEEKEHLQHLEVYYTQTWSERDNPIQIDAKPHPYRKKGINIRADLTDRAPTEEVYETLDNNLVTTEIDAVLNRYNVEFRRYDSKKNKMKALFEQKHRVIVPPNRYVQCRCGFYEEFPCGMSTDDLGVKYSKCPDCGKSSFYFGTYE